MPNDKASAAALRRALDIIRDSKGTGTLIFGRADTPEDRLYIGRQRVYDEGRDLKVISWHAPAAAPFYTATVDDPRGLVLKRTIIEEERRVVRLIDEIVAAASSDAPDLTPSTFGDALLAELERSRDGAMRDVIATIQAEQYRIIRSAAEGTVVVQGGPGTGKTVVGLHRAAWLAYNVESLRRTGMLVVAPTPNLLTYISAVLPLLGVSDVMQIHLPALYGGSAVVGRVERWESDRTKGDASMAEVLRRALSDRVDRDPGDVTFTVGADRITIPAASMRDVVADALSRDLAHNDVRDVLRQTLAQVAHSSYLAHQREMGRPAVATASTIRRLNTITNLLDRVWPRFTPEELLRGLYGTQSWLVSACDGVLTVDQRAALYRAPENALSEERWSVADIFCLDELSHLLDGPPVSYGHIVVDEAQDLSPMQARSLSRRCPTGSFTLLGDLAQATGPWVRDTWDELLLHVAPPSHIVEELSIGYRVPATTLDLAARQLGYIAPGLTAPRSIRPGRNDPSVRHAPAEVLGSRLAGLVGSLLADSLSTAVVVDDTDFDRWDAELTTLDVPHGDGRAGDFSSACTLVPASLAKGLEFDAVVLVEPAKIVESSPHGRRVLYVAMTRCTHELHVLHTLPLPSGFSDLIDHPADDDATSVVDGPGWDPVPDAAPPAPAPDSDDALRSRVMSDLGRLSPHDLTLVAALVERLATPTERLDHP
ncbi:DNA/RNA helicase, superfamily I [Sanguibacter keddieii DSM 10542]|uniref:DNA/RNA helicase, superfamily I n=1 Tax=Sanguibacter keddieii (strain ATCC 51767 / DSM 10542 / NCFB 3025 / ST-74) TaxID=446469 RepID=D1BJC3_SANKS|nr:DNA/RNA helicase, superfamily I [Sanguibacter keddieii DSM 10542]